MPKGSDLTVEKNMREMNEHKHHHRSQRFQEQLATGKFVSIDKNVNLEPIGAAKQAEAAPLDDYDAERELLKNQIYWEGIISSL